MTEETILTAQSNTDAEGGQSEAVSEDPKRGTDAAEEQAKGTETPAGDAEKTENTDQDADGDGAEDEDGDDGAPEEYDAFALPEGMEMDEAAVEKFTPLAKELNLSQGQAQKVVSLYADMKQQEATAQAEAWSQQVEGWMTDIKTDKEVGGDKMEENIATARKAVESFGTPELKEAMEKYGFGNHPELIRFAYRVGKAIGEDQLVTGNTPVNGQMDRAEILYPGKKE